MSAWGEAIAAIFKSILAVFGWKADQAKKQNDDVAKADAAVTGKTPPPKD